MKLLRRTKIKIENRAGSAMGEPTRVELRFAVDATEAPLAYPDTPYPDPVEDLAVELSGPGLLATLVVPIGQARGWAADLFGAVSVAYREATGDPHALTNTELAALPPADRYQPGPGLLVVGDDTTPARVRFHIVLDVEGHCLDSASLRRRHRRDAHHPLQQHPPRRLRRRTPSRPPRLKGPAVVTAPAPGPYRLAGGGAHQPRGDVVSPIPASQPAEQSRLPADPGQRPRQPLSACP